MTDHPIPQNKMLTVGKVLSTRRSELGHTIDEISASTKIQKFYLERIEADQFDSFESETFLIGFIKNYSKALGLNTDKIMAIYRRTVKSTPKKDNISKVNKRRELNLSPRTLIGAILSALVLSVFFFLMFQLYNFQKIPELTINTPENGATIEEKEVTVSGITDSDSRVSINGVSIETLEDGSFEYIVELVPGTNTISVRSTKESNSSKEALKILTVTYEEVEDTVGVAVVEEPVKIQDSVRVVINGGDAWVQTIIDGSQVTGEILQNGFEETYTIKKGFELITGVPSVTQVFINDQPTAVPLTIADGVGKLTCSLETTLVICDN